MKLPGKQTSILPSAAKNISPASYEGLITEAKMVVTTYQCDAEQLAVDVRRTDVFRREDQNKKMSSELETATFSNFRHRRMHIFGGKFHGEL